MVWQLYTEMYRNDPDGAIGNDDCGQMSAWFVLFARGFYPTNPVGIAYVLGSPLFDRAGRGRPQPLDRRGTQQCTERPYLVGRVERAVADEELDRPRDLHRAGLPAWPGCRARARR